MKTKAQKEESIKKGEEMLKKSNAVVFIDFSKVKTADLRNLRQELKKAESPLFIMKKRLLGIMFKKHNLTFDDRQFKTSVGTVFTSSLEAASGSIYKFFKGLEKEKKIDAVRIVSLLPVMCNYRTVFYSRLFATPVRISAAPKHLPRVCRCADRPRLIHRANRPLPSSVRVPGAGP